jgi:tRNA A-37 threonylcarbamoyl transferase component Bud32
MADRDPVILLHRDDPKEDTLSDRPQPFELQPGRLIGGKYEVESLLGAGWEGEVYKVVERRTRAARAAKLFFPKRNHADRAVLFYARKLEHLSDCPLVIKYHHSETLWWRGVRITALISEYFEGTLLEDAVATCRGKRFETYEALRLLHVLASGLERIHAKRDYHGDLHAGNIMVRRRGVHLDAKVVDLFNWGRPSAANTREDVANLVRVFYDVLGGQRTYARHPPEIRAICCGLKRTLIARRFPTARHLREHLDSFEWTSR